jgi:hypothetical protein
MTEFETHHAAIDATIEKLGLSINADFVPWSKSRKFKEDAKLTDYSLN